MKNKNISFMTQAAMIAAIYVVLTYVFAPFSFGEVQVRISEALTILPVFTPAAIAGLFAIRKYLFCNFDESDHIICRGSQTVRHANLIAGVKIPEESNCLLRDVVARQLVSKEKSISIGACIYYKDCALRIDNMRDDLITRVEVIKTL